MKKTILIAAIAFISTINGTYANQCNVEKDTINLEIVDLKTLNVSSFCKAIIQGDIDMVEKLINLGEDVNKKSLGMTPAIFAARYNKVAILKLLIEKGANLKIKSDNGLTVMKQAKRSNAKDVIAMLNALKK